MTQNTDEIKALLYDISTSGLTCSARLIAVIHALGIEDPVEIEKLTGLKEAGARKARRQLKDYRHSSGAPEYRDTPVAHQSIGPTPEYRSNADDLAPAYITTRATNEYPTDIVISKKLVDSISLAEIEIEGLNGHTSMYVDWLAEWLSPFAPDRQTARSILISNIDLYSAPKVKAGMVELKALIAGGEKPRNLVKSFSAFIKNANTEATPRPTAKSKVDARFATALAALETVGAH